MKQFLNHFKMSKSLLFIVPTDEMGGAEQITKQLAIKYQTIQADVQVICLTKASSKNGWGDYNGRIHYFKTANVFVGFLYLSFYIFSKKFDLVFSSQVYVNGLLGFLRSLRLYRTSRLVVRESTTIFLRFSGFKLWTYKLCYKIGYSNSDLIVCQTNLMQRQLIENVSSLKYNNIRVLQNPINLADIIRKSGLDNEFGKIEGRFLVSLGRMVEAKGFDILIHSFNRLIKQFPDMKLLILGDGSEREQLRALVDKYKLSERILMPGYAFNPFPYLKAAEVCVISSRIEGYPNILLEMMSLNDKVVCTKCAGGIEEIEGVNVCETNSIDGLYSSIIDAIKNSDADENRLLFDVYLKERSVENFISKME
jgi:glycosyltransferase involved in cell wall biosynthesis